MLSSEVRNAAWKETSLWLAMIQPRSRRGVSTNPGTNLNMVFSDLLQKDRTIPVIHGRQRLPECGSLAFIAGPLNDPL
jgi:hypothetical protein